jgi:uncharacterized protein YecE (DUF72 family)
MNRPILPPNSSLQWRSMAKVYAGTSGWAYASWKPKFYPPKLASTDFLNFYAGRLNSVEVNYTFRNFPTKRLLAGWMAATPPSFRFAVKAHQGITHFKRLRGVSGPTRKFLASLEPLREARKLGPVLFQLPPNFKCDLERLMNFLELLPRRVRVAFEFRHPSWFVEEVFDALRRANAALCLAESDALQTPDVHTADFSYFRLRKEKCSAKARKALALRVKRCARRGDLFVYFKHEDDPRGAINAMELLEEMRNE